MEEIVLSQFAHRVGAVLRGETLCDGCFHKFKDGEIGFRCMECSGFIQPNSNDRHVRQVDLTATVWGHMDNKGSFAFSNTTPYSGYDLCLACAKNRNLHNHHHFTLAVCQSS